MMTSIVAIKETNKTIVCFDSRSTECGYIKTQMPAGYTKAWKVGKTIIAHAGNFVGYNLLHENPQFFKKKLSTKKLVNEIVPSIFELFENRGQTGTNSDGLRIIHSSFIIANSKHLWSIAPTGEVIENDFVAIGSFQESLACYELIKGEHNAEITALKIVSTIAKIDETVGYPLYLMDTKSDKIQIFENENVLITYLRGMFSKTTKKTVN